MECRDVEQFFDAFLDGELDGSLRLEFDAHRLRCRECQSKLAMLESCEHVLATEAREPELSGDFSDNVMAAIERVQQPSSARHMRRLWTVAALAPAAMLLVFSFAIPYFRTPAPSPNPELEFVSDEELRNAMNDRVDLYSLIMNEAERLWAAKNNITTDARALPQYVVNLLPANTERPVLSPFQVLNLLAPLDTVEEQPDAGTSDEFSL